MQEELRKDTLFCLFPALHEIKDETLKNNTASALKIAIERGGHNEENVRLVPVTLAYEGVKVSLVEHINSVADLCIHGYNSISTQVLRNGVRFDWDLIVAGALLHDIGKFTEYRRTDNGYEASETGKLMRHPFSGMLMAAECGLPYDILQIIGTHSFEGNQDPQTAESEYLRRMDMLAFTMCVCGLSKR